MPDKDQRVAEAVAYLRRTQQPEGSWYGRWGMNYIYGTWSVLSALNTAGVDHKRVARVRGIQRGAQAIRGIVVEVPKAGEVRACLVGQRRLGVRSKEMIAPLAKALERVSPGEPVEIADAAAPVSEVEVMLRAALDRCDPSGRWSAAALDGLRRRLARGCGARGRRGRAAIGLGRALGFALGGAVGR